MTAETDTRVLALLEIVSDDEKTVHQRHLAAARLSFIVCQEHGAEYRTQAVYAIVDALRDAAVELARYDARVMSAEEAVAMSGGRA